MSKKNNSKNILDAEAQAEEIVSVSPENSTDEAASNFAEPVAISQKQLKKQEKQEKHNKEVQKKLALKAKKAKERERKSEERIQNGDPTLRDVFGQMFKKKKKPEPVVQKRVKRVKTDYQTGLSSDQVQHLPV